MIGGGISKISALSLQPNQHSADGVCLDLRSLVVIWNKQTPTSNILHLAPLGSLASAPFLDQNSLDSLLQ